MIGKEAILKALSLKTYYTSELASLRISADKGMALCPFHEDKNPSLSIDMETGVYHCFGCEASGDVFSFHMEKHRLPGRQRIVIRRMKSSAVLLHHLAVVLLSRLDFRAARPRWRRCP